MQSIESYNNTTRERHYSSSERNIIELQKQAMREHLYEQNHPDCWLKITDYATRWKLSQRKVEEMIATGALKNALAKGTETRGKRKLLLRWYNPFSHKMDYSVP